VIGTRRTGRLSRGLPPKEEMAMNIQVMHNVSIATQRGEMTFPQVVAKLLEAGVESYLVDFASGRKTFCLADGGTHTESMILDLPPVARNFSSADLVAAIRGAQADTVRYPEFVARATSAGTVGYWALLTGKRVVYFGRKGEQHIEEFPRANP
jgi:uncharacterized protein YbcV (DUF1398 family)